jgi:lipopolysaccharide transport system permease protein/teichoic acid transport system permease protein
MAVREQGQKFMLDMILQRAQLWELIQKELKLRYLGSFLGVFWAFIQPAITLFIFWFVFEIGFRVVPVGNVPFVPWLMCGMIPWFFLSDSIAAATLAVKDNAFLVKKMVFRVSMLPVVKIGAAFFVHIVFVGILLAVFIAYGRYPTLYWLQIPYYVIASLILVCGISWLTASLVVFLPDIGQLTVMVLQFLFWLTPIFWQPSMLPEQYVKILWLNPFFYIVQGYRNALIEQRWFWQDSMQSGIFWLIAILTLVMGAVVFRRLRPHFADVL